MLPEGPPWVLGLIPVFIGIAYLIMMKLAADPNNGK
jgi:cadmium resistance protein CadD (predicted permease)